MGIAALHPSYRLTLVFAQEANWAWPTLFSIAAFWFWGVIVLSVGDRNARKAREVPKWI